MVFIKYFVFTVILIQIANNKYGLCDKIPYLIGNTLVFVSPENLVEMQPVFDLLSKNMRFGGQAAVEETINSEKNTKIREPNSNSIPKPVQPDTVVGKQIENPEKTNTRIRKSAAKNLNGENSNLESRFLRNSPDSEELPAQALQGSVPVPEKVMRGPQLPLIKSSGLSVIRGPLLRPVVHFKRRVEEEPVDNPGLEGKPVIIAEPGAEENPEVNAKAGAEAQPGASINPGAGGKPLAGGKPGTGGPGSSDQPESVDYPFLYPGGSESELVTISSCTCGQPEKRRVIGGQLTDIKKYPWMVQLIYLPYRQQFCGGTIINDKYILTAAHCLTILEPRDCQVRVEHTSSLYPGYFVDVEEFITHRGYKGWNVEYYDIGLVKLKERLEFSNKALPICLPPEIVDIRDTPGVVAGWGIYDYEASKSSDTLREASVIIKNHHQCRNSSQYEDDQLNELIVCARDENIDTCQGDSGGPLAYKEDDTFIQIGITSWGIGCAFDNFPGIYTNVYQYYDWIIQRTSDAHWCKSPVWRTAEIFHNRK